MSRTQAGPILDIRGISKLYGGVPALDDLSLSVGDNEYLTLLGPSGSGKSVLLRAIAGFEHPEAGEILLRAESVLGRPAHLRGIGFVFQSFALFPHMSVAENVAFGLVNRAVAAVADKAEVNRRVGAMLELVGLSGLGGRRTNQISGGQRQRVALARTLVTEPAIILLDEPLGALDANLRQRMQRELRRIREQLGITFVHVTGNENEALAMGDRIAIMDRGRVLQVGRPTDVYEAPADAAVARFLNTFNIFEGRLERPGEFVAAEGPLRAPPGAAAGGPAAYAIRIDRMTVRPAASALRPDETGLDVTYVTSEYTGSTLMHFFRHGGGKVMEVEHHLSHRQPEVYQAGERYRLAWPAAAGQVLPTA
jgi:ABC-type Fe3+/spermidine/putrescine transport system ATPase subunit